MSISDDMSYKLPERKSDHYEIAKPDTSPLYEAIDNLRIELELEQLHSLKQFDLVTDLRAKLATADRCLRHCYEKLQPLVSFEEWLKQWEKV